MDVERLNKAFTVFTAASHSLEAAYAMLQEKADRLASELEARNRQVRDLEAQQERNKRLIAMGEMAARIVHEIRNPLCSVELYASMLEAELASSEHRRLAAGISAGVSGMNRILTNMLDFARPRRIVLRSARLDRIAEEALAFVKPIAENRGVLIDCTLAPREVIADAELLKQVFMNIIINAIQAVRPAGAVRVCVGEWNGAPAAAVSDEGEGIRPEHRERIFDPFFTTKDAGTGLGLAVAARIMEAHGGTISVESEPGAGSTFRLLFPAPVSGPSSDPGAATSDKEHSHACTFDPSHPGD